MFSLMLLATEQELFDKIAQAYKGKDYETCADLSEEFINKYPSSAKLPLVKLLYAVSLTELEEYEQAEQAFLDIAQNYPDFNKMDAAIYGLARLYEKWGKYEEAKVRYQEVINTFPDSKYASMAQKALKQLAAKSSGLKKTAWSIRKITWAKIASVSCFALSGVAFLLVGSYDSMAESNYQKFQDYYNSYKSTGNVDDLETAIDYENKAQNYERTAWAFFYTGIGAAVAGVGFFVADFLKVGRVEVSAVPGNFRLCYKTEF